MSCVVCQSPQLLHKYLAAYAASLIKDKKVTEALGLYVQHGAPAAKSVFLIVDHTVLKDFEISIGYNELTKSV